ncbi:MAG: cob(I)yrinic acid a,c-diamide adenosyltransferase [Rhizobiaceae bacterium]|nr:cob(I)yrinic acid a,c-diamide adenosyltransferase [Rhizobiaceae bacterium]
MVILNKIYTKTGDDGSTGLGNGERRPKFDLRVSAYGSVDETNATIGVARLHTGEMSDLDAALSRIQNDLFDLGADLATPETDKNPEYPPLRIIEAQVVRLEKEIDGYTSELTPLRSFILPAGSPAASHLHLARTVARRAERLIVELAADETEIVNTAAIRYINRLSDFLFVAARITNNGGKDDVLWVPGDNR